MLQILFLFLVLAESIFEPTLGNETHPCKRECVVGKTKTCKYDFVVENYYSMDAMACYSCPEIKEHCYRKDCIVGGGIKRNIIVVNRQLPGPPIEVCVNDTIKVNLQNIIMNDESTTIHWHGQFVKEDPYMDGVPYVTQCPILVNSNFTYTFKATNPGTHFWHSHEKMQRGDGMFGMLVVNVPKDKDPHGGSFDEDLTEHQVMITDWTLKTRMDAYGDFIHGGALPAPDGILINGLGYMDIVNIDLRLPLATFHVQKGKRYRFRFVNAEFFDCPFTVSFDNHSLTAIGSDGHNVKAVDVDYFNIFAGERFDMILEANQSVDTYWMRVKGLEICDVNQVFQVALLKYEGSPNDMPTNDIPTYDTSAPSSGRLLNPLLGDEPDTIMINDLESLEPLENDLTTEDVVRHFIKISFNPVDNPTSYRFPFYGFYNVSANLRIVTPMLNDIAYGEAPLPLMPYRNELDEQLFCTNETEWAQRNCSVTLCSCPHVVKLPTNRVVELIVFDDGGRQAHHPMHLHGYAFRVVAWKKVGDTLSRAQIEDLDRQSLIERDFNTPIRKDTIAVPRGGYAILRIKTTNPGFWIFHCHVDIHADDGMRMVFKIGENSEMMDAPKGFPQCGNYPKKYSKRSTKTKSRLRTWKH